MKRLFTRAAMLLTVAATAFTFTACNDDNDGDGKKPFESDLIGAYVPAMQPEDTQGIYGDIFITPTWKDPENVPKVDLSAIFQQSVGIDFLLMMTSSMIPMMYAGGLDHFDFNNDGTFAFGYRELEDFANMKFSEKVYTFPGSETQELIPAGAITYYTQNGLLYFAVSKQFLTKIGQEKLNMDLTEIVNGMISTYHLENSIVSTNELFAIPLKYSIDEAGVVTIKVDLAMMKPFLPLLTELLPLLPEEVEFDMMGTGTPSKIPARKVVGELLDGLLNQTTALEIGIRLNKNA